MAIYLFSPRWGHGENTGLKHKSKPFSGMWDQPPEPSIAAYSVTEQKALLSRQDAVCGIDSTRAD
jgi:hypothetical protein